MKRKGVRSFECQIWIKSSSLNTSALPIPNAKRAISRGFPYLFSEFVGGVVVLSGKNVMKSARSHARDVGIGSIHIYIL